MKRSLYVHSTLLYTRVSSDDQARDGLSLAAQEERLRAYSVATGRTRPEVVVDAGHSGKSLERPGMRRILQMVRARRADSVIVIKLDRLTRSVRDLADLLDVFAKSGTALISVTESLDTSTAGGRLMLNLLASVSQWEREATGERTSFALAHKRRSGRIYGPVPYGFMRLNDKLLRHPKNYRVLQLIRKLRRDRVSLRDIVERFNQEGVKTPRGSQTWHVNTLQQVLTSKAYIERMKAA